MTHYSLVLRTCESITLSTSVRWGGGGGKLNKNPMSVITKDKNSKALQHGRYSNTLVPHTTSALTQFHNAS